MVEEKTFEVRRVVVWRVPAKNRAEAVKFTKRMMNKFFEGPYAGSLDTEFLASVR